MLQLSEHFSAGDRTESSEQLRRRHWFIKSRQDKAREEMLDERAEKNVTAFSASVIVATEIEIKAFEIKLDDYDEAIVISLMENAKRLDDVARRLLDVEDQIEQALAQAYVMEDGRRVFLTEDRSQAFDEHGTKVSHDELDYVLVPTNNDTWESFSEYKTEREAHLKAQENLILERKDIFEFQTKVDNAHEKISDGKIGKVDLDDLAAELDAATPASVKAHVPSFDSADNAPAAKAAFGSNANSATAISTATPSLALPVL